MKLIVLFLSIYQYLSILSIHGHNTLHTKHSLNSKVSAKKKCVTNHKSTKTWNHSITKDEKVPGRDSYSEGEIANIQINKNNQMNSMPSIDDQEKPVSNSIDESFQIWHNIGELSEDACNQSEDPSSDSESIDHLDYVTNIKHKSIYDENPSVTDMNSAYLHYIPSMSNSQSVYSKDDMESEEIESNDSLRPEPSDLDEITTGKDELTADKESIDKTSTFLADGITIKVENHDILDQSKSNYHGENMDKYSFDTAKYKALASSDDEFQDLEIAGNKGESLVFDENNNIHDSKIVLDQDRDASTYVSASSMEYVSESHPYTDKNCNKSDNTNRLTFLDKSNPINSILAGSDLIELLSSHVQLGLSILLPDTSLESNPNINAIFGGLNNSEQNMDDTKQEVSGMMQQCPTDDWGMREICSSQCKECFPPGIQRTRCLLLSIPVSLCETSKNCYAAGAIAYENYCYGNCRMPLGVNRSSRRVPPTECRSKCIQSAVSLCGTKCPGLDCVPATYKCQNEIAKEC